MTEKNNNNNIYQKLSNIQSNAAEILKDKINSGQAYKYFTEYQVLSFLKPLLGTEKLSIKFEDLPELDYKVEKVEKEWIVQYWKKATIFNCEDVLGQLREQIEIKFLALGKNPDIAKAKGSAETYAIKYFLMKTFMVPAADNLDPDKEQFSSKVETKELSEAEKEQVKKLREKHNLNNSNETTTSVKDNKKEVKRGDFKDGSDGDKAYFEAKYGNHYRFSVEYVNYREKKLNERAKVASCKKCDKLIGVDPYIFEPETAYFYHRICK